MKKEFLAHFQQLEAQRKDLFQQLISYKETDLNRKRSDGGWSAIQVVHHLIQAELGSLAYLQKKTQDISRSKQAGFLNRVRAFVLNFFLKSSIKFKVPAVLGDVPESASLKETAEKWEGVRASLLQLCLSLPEEAFTRDLFRHPIAGRMNLMQMLDFFDSHFQRHLKQIEGVLKEEGKKE